MPQSHLGFCISLLATALREENDLDKDRPTKAKKEMERGGKRTLLYCLTVRENMIDFVSLPTDIEMISL